MRSHGNLRSFASLIWVGFFLVNRNLPKAWCSLWFQASAKRTPSKNDKPILATKGHKRQKPAVFLTPQCCLRWDTAYRRCANLRSTPTTQPSAPAKRVLASIRLANTGPTTHQVSPESGCFKGGVCFFLFFFNRFLVYLFLFCFVLFFLFCLFVCLCVLFWVRGVGRVGLGPDIPQKGVRL